MCVCECECVRCFDVIFLIASYIKQSPNVNFFFQRARPTRLAVAHLLFAPCTKGKQRQGWTRTLKNSFFSRFGSKRKQIQNWNTHLNPASKNYRIFCCCFDVILFFNVRFCCFWSRLSLVLFWFVLRDSRTSFDCFWFCRVAVFSL